MKKVNKYVDNEISTLELDDSVYKILLANNINKIGDLWIKNKSELKNYGLNDKEIKYISIKLQLIGLDLNKKMY